jgi:hypothetical protein
VCLTEHGVAQTFAGGTALVWRYWQWADVGFHMGRRTWRVFQCCWHDHPHDLWLAHVSAKLLVVRGEPSVLSAIRSSGVTVVDFGDIDFDLCQRGFGYAYFEAPKIYSRLARARRRVVEGVSPKVAR